MQRIKELDYLRGLAALSIMLYHYMKWLYIYEGANSFIGKMSVYGVELFYILSGITLYHTYHQHLTLKKEQVIAFYVKRFFRIFPLFWLSILLAVGIGLKAVPVSKLCLNISGLFSIIAPHNYIAPGTWSIGNELVFYLLFPILLFTSRRSRFYFILNGVLFFLIFSYFAFYLFTPSATLHNQWSFYVHPFNHLFLFYAGMCIPLLLKKEVSSKGTALLCIAIGAGILFGFPAGKDGIHLLYGVNRYVFSIGALLICIGFYRSDFKFPGSIDTPLKHLGAWSYSIYLLHPFVYQMLCLLIRKAASLGFYFPQSNLLLITVAVLCTLFVSKFVYQCVEVYFIKKGAAILASFYKS